MIGPQTEFSQQLHASKYRLENETFEEYSHRIAREVFPYDEDQYHKFGKLLRDMKFLPGGRINVALGNNKLTAMNCFTSSEILDDLNSILSGLKEVGHILAMGGGVGINLSNLRPHNDSVSSTNGPAGGPVSFLKLFDVQGQIMSSTGGRRSAQLCCLNIDHPDIESYIRVKQDGHSLPAFNLSIGITDRFMKAVEQDLDFSLTFKDRTYKTVKARYLWDMIMRSTWDWGEPGILFLDTINRMNNLYYCEKIYTSNPCGEEVLPYNGCCLLGSFNLVSYITSNSGGFSWTELMEDIPLVVEALDNIIDIASYPSPKYRQQERNTRRIGIGVTGLANAGELLGYPYASDNFLKFTQTVFKALRDTAYEASIELAKDRGQFPFLDGSRGSYCNSPFILNLPDKIQDGIYEHGIRNSHLLAVAPTGTMSLCVDNTSSGIEPVFAHEFQRAVNEQVVTIKDYAYSKGVKGKTALELTPDEHLDVLSTVQKYVDSSVSKTINVGECSWDGFKDIYMKAWKAGCKGVTTFRNAGKRKGLLSCSIDPLTGKSNCGD